MRSSPLVVGVTPCCGNILRTSTAAIGIAGHQLDEGECPDCGMDLTEPISVHRDTAVKKARRWFQLNAQEIGGRWQWSANDAFCAFVEIHDCGNGE